MSEGMIVGAPPIRPVLLEAFPTYTLTLQRQIHPGATRPSPSATSKRSPPPVSPE